MRLLMKKAYCAMYCITIYYFSSLSLMYFAMVS